MSGVYPGGSEKYISGPVIAGNNAAADSSLAFAENVVPISGAKVRDAIFNFSGNAANILSNLTRLTFRAGQVPFVDTLPSYIRAWLGWMGKKAEMDANATAFNFPFHGYRGWSAPPGQGLRMELVKNASMLTPSVGLHEGINETDESLGFMYFLSQLYSVPASSTRFPISISTPGVLVGLVIPTPANVTLLRVYDSSGLVAEYTAADALIYSQEQLSGTTVSNPLYWKLPVERLVVSGVTRLEIGTSSGWTDGEIGIHTYVPAPPKAG